MLRGAWRARARGTGSAAATIAVFLTLSLVARSGCSEAGDQMPAGGAPPGRDASGPGGFVAGIALDPAKLTGNFTRCPECHSQLDASARKNAALHRVTVKADGAEGCFTCHDTQTCAYCHISGQYKAF